MVAASFLAGASAVAQPETFTDLGTIAESTTLVIPIHLNAGNEVRWFRVMLPSASTDAGFVDVWTYPNLNLPGNLPLPRVGVYRIDGTLSAWSRWDELTEANLSCGLMDPRAPITYPPIGGDEEFYSGESFRGQEGPLPASTYWIAVGNLLSFSPADWHVFSNGSATDPDRDTVLHLRVQPPNLPYCDADLNWDGSADAGDIDYLVNVLSGGDNPTGRFPDFNRDGNEDQDDVAALINTIAGGGCPD